MDDYIGHDDLRNKLQQILDNVTSIRNFAEAGRRRDPTHRSWAHDVKVSADPISRRHILVADDEPNIRSTINDVLRKYHVHVTIATNGAEAIECCWPRGISTWS
jgi:PleD family two-component response regulator